MNRKVLLAPSPFATIDPAPVEKLMAASFEVVKNPFGRRLTRDELMDLLPGIVGIIAGLEPLSRDVLEHSILRVISRCGAGLSNVDLKGAKELGIKVRHTPDAPITAVAELTVGALISLSRRVVQMDRDLHESHWVKQIGVQLEGKTMVVIGFGRIGRKVASLLRPFQVRLIAVDPAGNGPVDGVPILSISAALPQADVISLHASGESEILGDKEFDRVKHGAFLLNAGRGGLVNEVSLCRALDNGVLAGAWLDAFAAEPYGGPLTQYPQVILTPHIGSFTVECRRRMEMEAVENLLEAFEESTSNG